MTVAATEDCPVRRLFEITELLELFKVVDRLDDAWSQAAPPYEAPTVAEVDPPSPES